MNNLELKEDFLDIIKKEIYDFSEKSGIEIYFENNNIFVYGEILKEADAKKINIYINPEISMSRSAEKYHDYDMSINEDYYDGEIKIIKDLNKGIKSKNVKYKDLEVNIKFSFSEIDSQKYGQNKELQLFLYDIKKERANKIKEELINSPKPNVMNSKEVQALFTNLGDEQRNIPEHQMLKCQHYLGGGVLSHMLEHLGDLTHRMSERIFSSNGDLEMTIGFFQPKVKKGLETLKSGYGFLNEHNLNMENNYKYFLESGKINCSFEEWKEKALEMLNKYSEEHSKLTVYNKAQYAARETAVELGKLNINKAIEHLEYLNQILEDETYLKVASEYKEGGYKPKLKKIKKNRLKK